MLLERAKMNVKTHPQEGKTKAQNEEPHKAQGHDSGGRGQICCVTATQLIEYSRRGPLLTLYGKGRRSGPSHTGLTPPIPTHVF
jgi:hypothetical protein